MSSAASLSGARIKRGGFSRLWHTLKQLFHEVVAAIFAVLAFSWLNAAIRAWSRDAAYWLVAIAAVVGGLFLFFAFTSFQRARKI
jgi:multisubunit Na+/H+ antiporter MnhB subunit